MARYIDADKLKEECYYYDTEEDLERYVIKHGYADVVPKSEVEKLVQDGTRLGQENETLKDNNEHLAVMLEEAKAEVGKLQNELVIWKQNRFNLYQKLECYEIARQKVASEIFAEIERIILDNTYPDFNREHKPVNIWKAKAGYDALDELKKKYTEGVKKE